MNIVKANRKKITLAIFNLAKHSFAERAIRTGEARPERKVRMQNAAVIASGITTLY